MSCVFRSLLISFLLLCVPTTLRAALTADELLLIVNKNDPESRALADFYADARKVPAGRIIELDLPAGDELPFERYDRDVLLPVQDFLSDQKLVGKVRCLVTFRGVPLRIAALKVTPAIKTEITQLTEQSERVRQQLAAANADLDKAALQLNPKWKMPVGSGLRAEIGKALSARQFIAASLQTVSDPDARAKIAQRLNVLSAPVLAASIPAAVEPPSTQTAPGASTQPTQPTQPVQPTTRKLDVAALSPQQLFRHVYDPEARFRIREVARPLGLIDYASVLLRQSEFLIGTEQEASLDNELACIYWDSYPRGRWCDNPMLTPHTGPASVAGSVMMVMRLDGPSVQTVRDVIATSFRVEREGLTGQILLDSRGLPIAKSTTDPNYFFSIYDQSIVNLAGFLIGKTRLTPKLDVKPELVTKEQNPNVAIYCGWYNVENVVPPATFVPGAVGFHIASYTMISLQNWRPGDWARQLMLSGVVATIGPVAEPYLAAFPKPDEYFPLLMTGQLSLAEAYWRTTPWVSWRMVAVGDPLYRPFAKNPPVKVSDLPDNLRRFIEPAQAGR